jgi:hypothetical protein
MLFKTHQALAQREEWGKNLEKENIWTINLPLKFAPLQRSASRERSRNVKGSFSSPRPQKKSEETSFVFLEIFRSRSGIAHFSDFHGTKQ